MRLATAQGLSILVCNPRDQQQSVSLQIAAVVLERVNMKEVTFIPTAILIVFEAC